MKRRVFAVKVFQLLAVIAVLAFGGQEARAQAVEGCDPRILDAMQATAQARVAHAKAVADEIYDQDDSVLALTCFNKAAGVSAARAGQIFSGDFSQQLAPVIEDALAAMYNNFFDSVGYKSGAVNYSAAALDGTFNCDQPAQLWQQVNDDGINQDVPYATFDDLMAGNMMVPNAPSGAPLGGGIGNDYFASWSSENSQTAFTNLATAVNALPAPSVPSFAGATTPCQVLVTAGAIPGPCP